MVPLYNRTLLSKRKQKVLQYLLMQCEFNGSVSETLWEVKKARHKRLQLYVLIIDTMEKGKPYIQQSDQCLLEVGMGK